MMCDIERSFFPVEGRCFSHQDPLLDAGRKRRRSLEAESVRVGPGRNMLPEAWSCVARSDRDLEDETTNRD